MAPAATPARWHERTAARRVALGLVLVALIALGLGAVRKQVRDGNDFPIYWQAARDLLAGRSPYDVGSGLHGYVYLPWFALLLVPFALLPLPVAAAGWYAVNVACLVLAARELLTTLRAVGVRPRPRTLVLAALPLAGLAHDNLALGQSNLLLLWLCSLALRAAVDTGSPGRGIALGLAAALKMSAGLLVFPLVLRLRARMLAGFVVGVAFAALLPLAPLGPDVSAGIMRDWHAKVVAPATAGTLQGSSIIDQSPHAALRRLLVAEPAYAGRSVNVRALSSEAFARISRVVAIALLVAYLLVWLLAPARGTPRALLLDLALGCCAMVQVTGFNLKAQFVVLLLPAWLAATLAHERPARAPRALLLAAGALFLLSQPGLVGRAASNELLAWSSMAVGTLLLAAALVLLRFAVATPSPSASPAVAPQTRKAR